MKVEAWPIVLTVCLLGCADRKPFDHDPIQISGRPGTVYTRGDARAVIECGGGSVPSECGSVDSSGLTDQVYFDCSDEEFECLFNSSDVLAVPKAGLTLGKKYSAFHANLTVEQCFDDQATCAIAMIRSECTDAQVCGCRSAVKGRKTIFYFSRELGVTAFYTVGEPPTGVDSKMLADSVPLLTYVLVAKEGFLRAPLSLRRATSATNCNH